jgi:hypothetical protein
MPLIFDWKANGTTMLFEKRLPAEGSYQRSAKPLSASSNSNSQRPFRVCHSARIMSGRGCSARGTSPCARA